ncbi:MAG: hypothetical protein ACJ8DY_18295, partial [Xanthobacteraceae bacterium]
TCPDNPPKGMHVARSLPPMGMWCAGETDVLARLGGLPASPKMRELRAIVMPYHRRRFSVASSPCAISARRGVNYFTCAFLQ